MAQARKPGYRTSEFWLSLCALILGALIASGYVGDESTAGKVMAFAASAFTALGYNISRGMTKKAEALTSAISTQDPK